MDLAKASHSDAVQGDNENRTSRIGNTASKNRKQSTQQCAESVSKVGSFAVEQADTVRGFA